MAGKTTFDEGETVGLTLTSLVAHSELSKWCKRGRRKSRKRIWEFW
jgi:hypothetical protein